MWRVRRTLRVLTITGVAGVVVLLGALWFESRSEITLPAPTGPFAVGRAIYDWTDATGVDTAAPVAGTKRELLVWIWYPADRGKSLVDDYLPAFMREAVARDRSSPILRLITRDLAKVRGHSLRDAAVSSKQRSYPVAIMRAGASLEVMTYSTLAEDLASHGYVVVGFDAPYRTRLVVFPDGRAIQRTPENNPELYSGDELNRRAIKLLDAWTADVAFVADRLSQLNATDSTGRFTGRLDMTRLGVFGHSFGGATAAQFCAQDARCKAGIDIDGSLHGNVIRTGIHKPFMFLLSGQGDFSSDAEVRQVRADIQSVYDRLPANTRLRLSIRGANHFTFSDDGALLKSGILRGIMHLAGVLRIDGRRQLAVTAYCVHSFFDTYLKGAAPMPAPIGPDIQVLR